MKSYDLSWGNSVVVRSVFLHHTVGRSVVFSSDNLRGMDYTPHEGNERLINLTRQIIKRQVGIEYSYIVLTNGATGGVNIAMRAYKQRGYNSVLTRKPPYFPIYPSMIQAAGMQHKTENDLKKEEDKPVALIDSPTNPQGFIVKDTSNLLMPVIFDAVYHNRVYTDGIYTPPAHDIIVGSYSKLLGLNGLRVGWVATNDSLIYERLKILVTAEYCGLSASDSFILLELLSHIKGDKYWDAFETNARFWLDYNREEWSKLEKYFGGQEVSPNGMFYYSETDETCKKLLTKSGIVWTSGSSLGTSDDFARFNLGQDRKLVRSAVKEILKNDTI